VPCCTKRHTHSCSAIGWRATVSQVASGNPAKNTAMWSLRPCAGTGCGVPGSLYVPSGAKVATHASRSPRFQASTYSLTICGTSTPISSFCSGLRVVCQSLGACAPRPVPHGGPAGPSGRGDRDRDGDGRVRRRSRGSADEATDAASGSSSQGQRRHHVVSEGARWHRSPKTASGGANWTTAPATAQRVTGRPAKRRR
jgi:predicted small lipoprotein YifL